LEYNEIMEKIAVVGHKGRMGSLITKELQKDFEVVKIGRENSLSEMKGASLVIDFASHESSVVSAEYCLKNNIPLIIGSTGQTKEENKRIEEISKQIRLIKKANFSKGINVLKQFIEEVLKLEPERFEIIEKHHKNKKDAPSGTALELENFIRQKFDGDIKIKWVREGEEMGEHEVVAYLHDEKLSFKHNVFSRDAFVLGLIEDVKSFF